jgi:RNA polymerase sigma-70 factor (ECF subfamily)
MRRLYERYKGYAMSIGLRYIPDSDDVEDVVQDSFIKILTSIQRFDYRGEGSLKLWIGRTVANRAIDFIRQHERISFTGTIPDMPDEEPELERIPPNVLTNMIAQLPSGYRLVLNLYVFEHCSHREIAQRLGIRENSSSSQLSRAKMLLMKMMKDYIKQHEI